MSLTEGEKLKAQRMYAEHRGFQLIAKTLGRRVQDVHRCILPTMRKDAVRKRAMRDELAAMKIGHVAAGLFKHNPECPADAVVERDIRLASGYRDFTSEYLGDPRPGYSALDKKNALVKA